MKPTADGTIFILFFLISSLYSRIISDFKVVRKIFNYRLNENTQSLTVSKSIDGPNES